MYGIAVRDQQEDVMGGRWGHVLVLVDKLGEAAGLAPEAVYAVYRSEAARLGLAVQ